MTPKPTEPQFTTPFTWTELQKDPSQEVRTRDGRIVKGLSFTNDSQPLKGLLYGFGDKPSTERWDRDGKYLGECCPSCDLFLGIPETPCVICGKPVMGYIPKYCGGGPDCGCLNQLLEPCVCSEACDGAFFREIGTFEERRVKAGISAWSPATPSRPQLPEGEINGITWKEMATQLATVWWACWERGWNIQHGDWADESVLPHLTFSVVAPDHCWHAKTPQEAWNKAMDWIARRPSAMDLITQEVQPLERGYDSAVDTGATEGRLMEFIRRVESEDFRTDADFGANLAAMAMWNRVRKFAGLDPLSPDDLPKYDKGTDRYVMPTNSRLTTNRIAPSTEQQPTLEQELTAKLDSMSDGELKKELEKAGAKFEPEPAPTFQLGGTEVPELFKDFEQSAIRLWSAVKSDLSKAWKEAP